MPAESTLTSPLGTPVYSPRGEEREAYGASSRVARVVPLLVGAIGAAIIAGGAILYAAGVIGVPLLSPTEEAPAREPAWQPNPEFSKSLGVQALKNLQNIERRGSLQPAGQFPPAAADRGAREREMWEPPLAPKTPEGTEDLPKAADPTRTPPNGFAK